MHDLPALDAHLHLDTAKPEAELLEGGNAALAVTLSLDEAESALARVDRGCADRFILWGVGCHPGARDAQRAFDPVRFRRLAERAALIGEVGLDFAAAVPRARQLETFRAELAVAADLGRPVSVHSQNAVTAVLDELERSGVAGVILHWWTGNDAETARAVGLGYRFSLPAVLAADRDISVVIPPDRLLVETDSMYGEPPASVSAKLREAERLFAGRYGLEPAALRRLNWDNFRNLVRNACTADLLPNMIRGLLDNLPDG